MPSPIGRRGWHGDRSAVPALPPVPRHVAAERRQRLLADPVFDALGVDAGGLGADAEGAQETLDDLVAAPAVLGARPAGPSQEPPAIRALHDQPALAPPVQPLRPGPRRAAAPPGD